MRKSVISHPPKERFIELRAGYQAIVAGDDCGAILLAIFEHWTNYKHGYRAQAAYHNAAAQKDGMEPTQDETLWIYKSTDDLVEELLGHYQRKRIMASMQSLVEGYGYLDRRLNPRHRWDKTHQYLFQTERIQAELDRWSSDPTGYSAPTPVPKGTVESPSENSEEDESSVPKRTVDGPEKDRRQVQKGPAIPQDTTQETRQDTSCPVAPDGAPVQAANPRKALPGEDIMAYAARLRAMDQAKGGPDGSSQVEATPGKVANAGSVDGESASSSATTSASEEVLTPQPSSPGAARPPSSKRGRPKKDTAPEQGKLSKAERDALFDAIKPFVAGTRDPESLAKTSGALVSKNVTALVALGIRTPEQVVALGEYIKIKRGGHESPVHVEHWEKWLPTFDEHVRTGKPVVGFGDKQGAAHAASVEMAAKLKARYENPASSAKTPSVSVVRDDKELEL